MTVTVHLSRFLPLVLPHAPECPHGVATFNLRLAAIEFCERTRCWRHITNIKVQRERRALCAPAYAAIHHIERATWEDGTELEPLQFSHVDEGDFPPDAGGVPRFITQEQYNSIRVLPFSEGEVKLSLFLKPVNGMDMAQNAEGITQDAYDVVPEFIYTMHAEAIAAGALARLLAQPGKPWSNMEGAMLYGGRAREFMDQHFSVNLSGQHRAPRRSRFRFV